MGFPLCFVLPPHPCSLLHKLVCVRWTQWELKGAGGGEVGDVRDLMKIFFFFKVVFFKLSSAEWGKMHLAT